VNRTKVFRWYSRFRDRRELVEDDERWLSKIESNWGKHCCCCWFGQKWPSNRINNYKRIFEHLQDCVLRILKEDLGKRKLCARFVPHSLTTEQREDRVTSCQDIIAMPDADKNFLNKIITGDETWCFAYGPETKRQSSECVGQTSPRPKNLKFQKSHFKTMLKNFLDSQGLVHKEFVPQGKNSKCRIL